MNASYPFIIPLDVPSHAQFEYIRHYTSITSSKGNLLLFAADQRVEHMSSDFIGSNIIDKQDISPEHYFVIANEIGFGAMTSQLGLIARYGNQYPNIKYIIKLNSKTNLSKKNNINPLSQRWYNIDDIVTFKKNSGLTIVGIAYTVYIGSTYEYYMLAEAAQVFYKAHQHGLLCIAFIYPKGEKTTFSDKKYITSAAGIGTTLGADFVKVNFPKPITKDALLQITTYAGNTKVLFAGGTRTTDAQILQNITLAKQAGAAGVALGRNLHQRSKNDALHLSLKINKILYT